jgi:hypothetical protein
MTMQRHGVVVCSVGVQFLQPDSVRVTVATKSPRSVTCPSESGQ